MEVTVRVLEEKIVSLENELKAEKQKSYELECEAVRDKQNNERLHIRIDNGLRKIKEIASFPHLNNNQHKDLEEIEKELRG